MEKIWRVEFGLSWEQFHALSRSKALQDLHKLGSVTRLTWVFVLWTNGEVCQSPSLQFTAANCHYIDSQRRWGRFEPFRGFSCLLFVFMCASVQALASAEGNPTPLSSHFRRANRSMWVSGGNLSGTYLLLVAPFYFQTRKSLWFVWT